MNRDRPVEKDLGILIDEKLNWQFVIAAQKFKRILGCIRRSVASMSKEMILPHYSIVTRLNGLTKT